ncbi:MAG: ABC transporter substrate-binding protein [Deltaproteobacteria bacterium]|nr:ABC transporter substrate-binding protein [Deltaproteobacteria bacterium]
MRTKLFGRLFALLCCLLASTAMAQTKASLEKARVIYSAIGASQSSIWIPYEAGIFRKHGLDLELLYVGGGGRAAQVVQSGEVPIGMFTGGSVVSANLAGGDLVTIASGMNVIPFFLIARPEIRGIEDLKGKKIGISRFGSATDFALRYAEEKWPHKRGQDFAVIQMGGMPEMMAGLKSRALEAAMLNAEFAILARREGFKELADIVALGLNFPTSAINSTRSYIQRNENTVRKFIRGFVEGNHFLKTQRGFSIDVLKKYLKNEDRGFLNSVYDLYCLQYIPKVPYPSPEALRTVLAQMGEKDPKAAAAQPEQFIDSRFFQELEKDGFIQRLWQ